MRKALLALIAMFSLAVVGCAGIALVTYNAADVQQEKYLYDVKRYPDKTIDQLQIQLSTYKARCGLLPYLDYSMNFEKIAEGEHALFVQSTGGINTVMRTKDEDGVGVTTWTRAPRIAKYMINAIENGECKNSVWD